MDKHFIRKVKINKLRHLKDMEIKIDEFTRRPLIITGKSGSGKTTILEGMKDLLQYFENGQVDQMISDFDIDIDVADSDEVNSLYKTGKFVLAYYKAGRTTDFEIPNGVEQIILKNSYSVNDNPGKLFIKYLVDLKTQQAFALNEDDYDTVENIKKWFNKLEIILKIMFDDESTKLKFYYRSYNFKIIQDNREPYGLNELSSGYKAFLDIITDLMLRMDNNRACEVSDYEFDTEGIVLIDEIDVHLHSQSQKDILPFLRAIFPNIQFVITTHSENVMKSVKDAVIVDLDNLKEFKTSTVKEDPYELYYGVREVENDTVNIEDNNEPFNGNLDFSKIDNFVVKNSEEELQFFNDEHFEETDALSELAEKIEKARKQMLNDAEEYSRNNDIDKDRDLFQDIHREDVDISPRQEIQHEDISDREKIRRARISSVFKKYEDNRR